MVKRSPYLSEALTTLTSNLSLRLRRALALQREPARSFSISHSRLRRARLRSNVSLLAGYPNLYPSTVNTLAPHIGGLTKLFQ